MCIKLRRSGGRVVGIELNFKRTIYFIVTAAATVAAIGAMRVQCNNGIAYAQEAFVRSEAEAVFDSLHQPFEARLCSMKDSISKTKNDVAVLIEMVKISNSDKPNLYRDAKRAVEEAGRFPDED